MSHYFHFFLILLCIFVSRSAFAVWGTGEGFTYGEEDTGRFSAVCLIKNHKENSTGTGFLVAPRTVATIFHVTSDSETKENSAPLESFNVIFFNSNRKIEAKVTALSTFENRSEKLLPLGETTTWYDSVSLLLLDQVIEHIEPLTFSPQNNATSVTMVGFGRGGLLQDLFPDVDIRPKACVFRAVEKIFLPDGFKSNPFIHSEKLKTFEVNQRVAKFDRGDSGGPLLSEEGKVIGLNRLGAAKGMHILDFEKAVSKLRSEVDPLFEKAREEWVVTKKIESLYLKSIELDDKYTGLTKRLIELYEGEPKNSCCADFFNWFCGRSNPAVKESQEEIDRLKTEEVQLNAERKDLTTEIEELKSKERTPLPDIQALAANHHRDSIRTMLEVLQKDEKIVFGNSVLMLNDEAIRWAHDQIKGWETPEILLSEVETPKSEDNSLRKRTRN